MEYSRKNVIYHPDDAVGLEGKKVMTFDNWYDTPKEAIYMGKSLSSDYPFKVQVDGYVACQSFIIPEGENIGRLHIQSCADREAVTLALFNSGYMVWVETKEKGFATDYFVCFK